MKSGRRTKYPLFVKDSITEKPVINTNLPKQIQRALGKSAIEQMEETKRLKKEAKKNGRKRQTPSKNKH